MSPFRRQAGDAMGVVQPLLPLPLVISGVALVLAVVAVVLVPVALGIRVILQAG